MNGHVLRVACLAVRHPHRFSAAIVTGWRFGLARLPIELAHCRTHAEACAHLDRQSR